MPKITKSRKEKRTVYYAYPNPRIVEVDGILYPFKKGVGLFNYRRRWWLAYYGRDKSNNTGGFKTKKAAISWYDRGGR